MLQLLPACQLSVRMPRSQSVPSMLYQITTESSTHCAMEASRLLGHSSAAWQPAPAHFSSCLSLAAMHTCHTHVGSKTTLDIAVCLQELNLDLTMPTGQSFRWRKTGPNAYTGVIGTRVVSGMF